MRRVTVMRVGAALALVALGVGCDRSGEPPTDASRSAVIGEGEAAPRFSLPSTAGTQVELSDYRDKRPVLLYFSMGPG